MFVLPIHFSLVIPIYVTSEEAYFRCIICRISEQFGVHIAGICLSYNRGYLFPNILRLQIAQTFELGLIKSTSLQPKTFACFTMLY